MEQTRLEKIQDDEDEPWRQQMKRADHLAPRQDDKAPDDAKTSTEAPNSKRMQ